MAPTLACRSVALSIFASSLASPTSQSEGSGSKHEMILRQIALSRSGKRPVAGKTHRSFFHLFHQIVSDRRNGRWRNSAWEISEEERKERTEKQVRIGLGLSKQLLTQMSLGWCSSVSRMYSSSGLRQGTTAKSDVLLAGLILLISRHGRMKRKRRVNRQGNFQSHVASYPDCVVCEFRAIPLARLEVCENGGA